MPDPVSPAPIERLDDYLNLLAQSRPGVDAVAISSVVLDDVSIHDFAFHEFILAPEAGYGQRRPLSDVALGYLDEVEQHGAPPEMLDALAGFLEEFEHAVRQAFFGHYASTQAGINLTWALEALYWSNANIVERLFQISQRVAADIDGFHAALAADLGCYLRFNNSFEWRAWFRAAMPVSERWQISFDDPTYRALLAIFRQMFDPWGYPRLEEWLYGKMTATAAKPALPPSYPFEPFPARSVNVGLRFVYRQVWTPLGLQRGEIVRTVPLGPGQKEKVSVKIVRRRKSTSSMETSTERETTTETTDSTKDSNEIVAEAASTLNWNVSAKASASFLVASAELSSSVGGGSEDKHKDTSSRLSEAVRKAASKIRSETKVVVTTEQEDTQETERVSEIVNTNNEMAVNYIYRKLQQQYSAFTALAELHTVIYVAEALPHPIEINADWVRRNDWIIAKALKDSSHAATLNELIQDVDNEPDPVAGADPFEAMRDEAQLRFAQFTSAGTGPGAGGLTVPDIYAEPQRQYRDRLRDKTARSSANELRRLRRDRLFQHIRDNILYYMRAIWTNEDADQRLLRYRKENRRVPLEWATEDVLLGNGVGARNLTPRGRDVALTDVIDPTGPIDYVGNYAAWALRPIEEQPDARLESAPNGQLSLVMNLAFVLTLARAPYSDPDNPDDLVDPALRLFVRRAGTTMSAGRLRTLTDRQVQDLLSYLPRLEPVLVDTADPAHPVLRLANGDLANPPSIEDYGEYLYRRNGTRRFLVDSNNLDLSIGSALEPFKRVHRYIDALAAAEDVQAARLKNLRRANLVQSDRAFDPDIEKIIVVDSSAQAVAAAAGGAAGGAPPAPVPPVA